VDSVQWSDVAPAFGNMSQSEKVFEIKLLLKQTTDFFPPRGK
jgi:hypothetical protein